MAKGKVTPKSLRAGQTIFRVYGLGAGSFVQKLIITSRAYVYKNPHNIPDGGSLKGTMWANYKQHYTSCVYNKDMVIEDTFSLGDAGICERGDRSTLHRTFYTEKAANRWKEYCLTQANPHAVDWEEDLWNPMDYCDWDHGDPDE